MKKTVQKVCGFAARHSKKVAVLAATFGVAFLANAQSSTISATKIATDTNTAFGVIAPITISIVGFYVILRLAKRTVK
jgi:hypothetical protein